MARFVFMMAGCKPVAVPVDGEGLVVTVGIQRARNARAVFVTPSHQFPLGVTMSAWRRLELLQWAQKSGAWIIEDDYDSEYRYATRPVASLQGLDTDSRVIYIGTFSKVLFPSMRLGYMVVPPDLVERFATIRHAIDLGLLRPINPLSPISLTKDILPGTCGVCGCSTVLGEGLWLRP